MLRKRRLKATWTIELDNELRTIFGIKLEEKTKIQLFEESIKNYEFIDEKEFMI